jgi:hypothetical protein
VNGSANGLGSSKNIAANRTSMIAEMDNIILFNFAFFFKSGSDFHLGNRGLSPIVVEMQRGFVGRPQKLTPVSI